MRRGLFVIDTLAGEPLSGWTEGNDWNGWAIPLFEAREAREIIERQNALAPDSAWYDQERDEFRFRLDDREPERYEGVDLDAGCCRVRVYALGSGSWIWEEAEDEE